MSQEQFKLTRTWVEAEKKHRQFSSVICGECGRIENLAITKGAQLPPEVTTKTMQRRGWVMGQKRKDDLCPRCVAEKVKERKATNVMEFPKQPTPIAPAAQSPQPTPASRESKRLVILALEDQYLGADQGYVHGYSDERIAKELNVPRKLVADLREEFYGPETDPEITKVRAEMKALEAKLSAAVLHLSDLRSMLNDLKERASKKGML